VSIEATQPGEVFFLEFRYTHGALLSACVDSFSWDQGSGIFRTRAAALTLPLCCGDPAVPDASLADGLLVWALGVGVCAVRACLCGWDSNGGGARGGKVRLEIFCRGGCNKTWSVSLARCRTTTTNAQFGIEACV
jgi:hypothetical protein